MNKSNYTRNALIVSMLSMILCTAMFIGSTFAWFSDSVVSGNNKIVAGNLDVEMEYKFLQENGKLSDWKPVNSATSVFKDGTLWEPGHTEFIYLRIRNAGSLALKYRLSVNLYADQDGTPEKSYTSVLEDENGNYTKFKLSEHLVFRQFDEQKAINRRSDLWIKDATEEKEAMGKLDALGKTNNELLPSNEDILTLAVYMPTQVGNEANQLTSAKETEGEPTIFLDLDLQATQTTNESDSFDDHYDEPAPITYKVNASNINSYLNGEQGSLKNAKLVLSPGAYDLKIGEPSKSENGDTVYQCKNTAKHEVLSFTNAEEYKKHKQEVCVSGYPYYTRTIENLTIVGEEGVSINGLSIISRQIYGASVNDPILDRNVSYFLNHDIKNLTFENVNFTGKVNIQALIEDTNMNGITFDHCEFNINNTDATAGQAINYHNQYNNGNVKNLVVKDCIFNNCAQGVHTIQVNGITVTGCQFNTINNNAINIISANYGPVDHKAVNIQDNTFENVNIRAIEFGKVGADTQITIKNNIAKNSGTSSSNIMMATSLADGITYDISNNNWGVKQPVNDELKDK